MFRQLARLTLREDEALHNPFIRTQELSTRMEQEAEHLSELLLDSRVLSGLPERYEHFIAHESLNPAGSFVEVRTRTTNYGVSCLHRESVDDVDSHVAMTSKKARPTHKPSKYNAAPESSSRQLTCYCCGMKGHMKAECYKREAECTFLSKTANLKNKNELKGGKHGS